MSAPVMKRETEERRHTSVFAERESELERNAARMPRPLEGEYPFLMGIKDGAIYPYTREMAERSDLVVGCYNLEGSQDPEDWERGYDPRAVESEAEKRAKRITEVKGVSAAERKAWEAAERKRIREELEADLRAKMEKEIRAEMTNKGKGKVEPEPTEPAKAPTDKPAKKATAKKPSTTKNTTVVQAEKVATEPVKATDEEVTEKSLADDVAGILKS